jgi:hypothetical protein
MLFKIRFFIFREFDSIGRIADDDVEPIFDAEHPFGVEPVGMGVLVERVPRSDLVRFIVGKPKIDQFVFQSESKFGELFFQFDFFASAVGVEYLFPDVEKIVFQFYNMGAF